MSRLRLVALERLMRCFWLAADLARRHPRGGATITSAQFGRALDVDPSQIRKDFAAVDLAGRTRVGYEVGDVHRAIRSALGFDIPYSAVLIGVGHLGASLLEYGGFWAYGLRIVAAFDVNPKRIGRRIGGCRVHPMNELELLIAEHRAPLAILTTPVGASQALADRLVAGGVKALWNFSPTCLAVPDGILARNENISIGLAEIAHFLNVQPGAARPARARAPAPEDPADG